MTRKMSAVVLSAVMLLGSGALATAQVRLGYDLEQGQAWSTTLTINVDFPFHDPIELPVTYHQTCKAHTSDGYVIAVNVEETENRYYGTPVPPFAATYSLTRRGRVSSLESQQLGDPYQKVFIENSTALYFMLPQGEVKVGDSWPVETTIYLLKSKFMGHGEGHVSIPESLPLKGLATLRALVDGRYAALNLTATEGRGAGLEANLSGDAHFDLREGYLVACYLSGTIGKRLLGLVTVNVPLTLHFQVPGAYDPRTKQAPDRPDEAHDRLATTGN